MKATYYHIPAYRTIARSLCKQLIPIAVMLFTSTSITAGINSGMPDGFLDRGIFYSSAGFNAAAIDQLAHFETITDGDRKSMLDMALAAACDADPRAINLLETFLYHYPQSAERHLVATVIGNCYMDRKEWIKAYRWYSTVGSNSLDSSTDARRRLMMGIALLMAGHHSDADNIFSSLETTGENATASFFRGYIAYTDGDYSLACTLLEDITSSTMPAAMAPYMLSQIYYMQGDYDKALSYARRVINNDGTPAEYRAEASRIAGESLYITGSTERAIPYLKNYVADTPGTPLPSALYILGMSEYQTAGYQQAIETLKSPSMLNDAMGQSSLLTIGQSYMALGDVSSAIVALNKAVQLDADDKVTEEAYYNYCVARSDGGRVPFGSSVEVFEDFLKRYPGSRYANKVSEYLAYGYMSDDNYDAALANIEKIKNPSSRIIAAKQQVLYTLGARDLAAGQYDKAISYLDQARDITGQDRDITTECDLLLGDCYYKKADYTKAATLYTAYISKVQSSSSNRALALYNLGYALFARNEYASARKRFEQAINIPGITIAMEADATCRIADTYYVERNLDKAIRYYETASRIDPAKADYPMYQNATLLGWKEEPNKQIQALEAMMSRFPKSPLVPQALLDIAEAQTNGNHIDNAIQTYYRLEKEFGNTAQGRQAMLLMGSLQSSNNRSDDAYETYTRLIKQHSPSREATIAARNLQDLAIETNRLENYLAFMSSVPNAPAIDPSELDKATFSSARTAKQWEAYLQRFPSGEYAPQAMILLARDATANGDQQAALDYSSTLLEKYPDGDLAADALVIKADAQASLGMTPEAFETYRQASLRASDANVLNHTRMGQLKAARDLGRNEDVIELADILLSSSTPGSGQHNDVSFIKAIALSNTGDSQKAIEIWEMLSANPADLTGSKSLYYMAQHFYDINDMDRAWKAVNTLVGSNTPHSYWLARGYILTSDLYRARGDIFEADEYLKSLRTNYPGNEPDIFNMIDTRLK